MRTKIIDSIYYKMKSNEKIFFLTADMGMNLVEKIEKSFPNRFANIGIAEQNMIGVSAGLVNAGFRSFVYTISNFAVIRCLEQIRNDILLHNYPITILGSGTGYDYSALGPTHHSIDEWGILKGLPNIEIYCPSTVEYSTNIIEKILSKKVPAYIRIPKGTYDFQNGGNDYYNLQGKRKKHLLISYGSIAPNCIEAMKINENLNILILNKLKPLDGKLISEILNEYENLWVVEDHLPNSGMFSVICEINARKRLNKNVFSLAPNEYTLDVGGSPDYFHKKYKIDTNGILQSISNFN